MRNTILFLILIFVCVPPFLFAQDAATEQLARDALEQSVMTQEQLNALSVEVSSKLDNISSLITSLLSKQKEVTPKDSSSSSNKADAAEAYKRAQNLSSVGEIKEALIYYLIAAYTDKGEQKYITAYLKTVIISAENLAKDKLYKEAYDRLADLELFIMNSFDMISPRLSSDIVRILSEIDTGKRSYLASIKNEELKNKRAKIELLLSEGGAILKQPLPTDAIQMDEYIKRVESIVTPLMRLSADTPNENIDKLVAQLGKNLTTVSSALEIRKTLQRGNEISELLKTQKDIHVSQQLITEGAYLWQKLSSLLPFVDSALKLEVEQYQQQFIKLRDNLNTSVSYQEYLKLKNRFDAVNKTLLKNRDKAETALSQLYLLQDELIVDSSKIADSGYLKETRALLNQLTKEINNWQEIQLRSYERFSVSKIKEFHTIYSKELGILGSSRDTKTKIYFGMKDYLCPIETRYLSASGSKVYSEVFDYFYKELDRDQRITLSEEFVDCDKKPLSDF